METATRSHQYQRLNTARKAVQILSVLFLIAVPVLNWMGIHAILGTLYSISIGELDIVDPAMAFQTILLTREVYGPLLVAILVPIGLALVFGRVFCSWICPHNTISEWLDALHLRLSKKRWREAHPARVQVNPHPVYTWGLLGVLALLMMVLGFPLLSYLSMPGIISSQISQAILGMGIGLELGLVVLVLVIEFVLFRRVWCAFLCPVGAVLSMFRTRYTLRVHHDAARCDCRQGSEPCHYLCPLDLAPKHAHLYPNCFNCGICVAMCEKLGKRALTFALGTNTEANDGETEPEAENVIPSATHRP